MAVLIDAKTILFQKISSLTKVTLDESNATLSNVRPYTGTTSIRNTSIDVLQNGTDEPFTVHYDRIKIGDLDFTTELDDLYLIHGESTHELLEEMFKWTNFHFTTDDVEDLPVVHLGGGIYRCDLKAKSDSLLWMGEGHFTFRDMPGIDGIIFSKVNMGYI